MRFLCLFFVAFCSFSAQAQPLFPFLRDKTGFQVQKTAPNRLQLTSQKWKGTLWKHELAIYRPKKLVHPDACVLLLTTGKSPWDGLTGQLGADTLGATFAVLYDVPNQPLWGQREDDLFGYTLEKMIATRQSDWNLAFPMARAGVRAMDALDSWNKKPFNRHFLIGFSKRGLAAWLGATQPRVAGLVSLGYNNLNVPKQATAQRRAWNGQMSPRLRPYTQNGIQEFFETQAGAPFAASFDPFSYRRFLNKPILVLDSTGNDYWGLDAFDQYAAQMPRRPDFLMMRSESHYMEDVFLSAFESAAAWTRAQLDGKKLAQPKLEKRGEKWVLRAPNAQSATLYFTGSDSRDFRGKSWSEIAMKKASGGNWEAVLSPQIEKNRAIFGEAIWPQGRLQLRLSSPVVFP